jgi:predicted DNA-binding transcriptional regulator
MRLEYALRGKDWKVYWLLLKNSRPMSVREVQRALRFSSPRGFFHDVLWDLPIDVEAKFQP